MMFRKAEAERQHLTTQSQTLKDKEQRRKADQRKDITFRKTELERKHHPRHSQSEEQKQTLKDKDQKRKADQRKDISFKKTDRGRKKTSCKTVTVRGAEKNS